MRPSGSVDTLKYKTSMNFGSTQGLETEEERAEAERLRKEKAKWKYMKDEEKRQKMLVMLKEKLE
jgi:hypothetical protein